MDETTLGLHPVLNRCWMKRGEQKRVPTPGQPQWQHLVGAYNYVTDEVIALPVAKKTSDGFIPFLDPFLQQHTTERPVVWILDNASIHHSLASQAAFSLCEEQLMPLFLPAYCSDLNPIERFWQHLKSYACANKLFPTMDAVVASVNACLRRQNDLSNPLRYSICKNFRAST